MQPSEATSLQPLYELDAEPRPEDVAIDRCRDGVEGCPPLGQGTYQDWKPGEVVETTPGTYEVHLELRPSDGADIPVIFVVGPGTAADGSDVNLLVLDVRPN